jgi:uncharacterized protein
MTAAAGQQGMLSSVVLKAAAPCNLNCSYCYVYNHEDRSWRDRPKAIGDDVFDATLRAVKAYCDCRNGHSMFITLHGGEPLLIGAARFDELATRAERFLGPRLAALSVQTNGTLIDDRWIAVFLRHQTWVGVSLDGPPEIHDAVRVDHAGRGSYRAAVAGLNRLREAGVPSSILCVINPGYSGLEVYRHFRAIGVKRMNFLLPDVSHDSKLRWYGGKGPTPVADFLIPIFDEWVREDDESMCIRLFWGLLRQMLDGDGETDLFGNPLLSYVVVETDGAIEALDALRVCRAGLGKSGLNVLHHSFDDLSLGDPFLYQAVHSGVPLCVQCQACPERELCGGGYLPHRYARANGFDNPSVWCADILKLLEHMRAWVRRTSVGTKPPKGKKRGQRTRDRLEPVESIA